MTPEEGWLNSDREILNRCVKTQGKVGILLTLEMPNGNQFQAEVDRLNAETGSSYCHMCREYYDEWKASKESASRRKQRDRAEQALLDEAGNELRREPEAGTFPVQETVQALEEAVRGTTTLEEDVFRRITAAEDYMKRLLDTRDRVNDKIIKLDTEYKQLMSMKEIFNASKVLEQASEGVHTKEPAGSEEGSK